jgi:hypothetical protein
MFDLNEVTLNDHVEDGVWIDVPGTEGLRLQVRSRRSKAYKKVHGRELRRFSQMVSRRGGANVDQVAAMTRIDNAAIAEACLLGWDGLLQAGEPLPFTADRAKVLMTEPAMEVFQEMVRDAVSAADEQAIGLVESTVEN